MTPNESTGQNTHQQVKANIAVELVFDDASRQLSALLSSSPTEISTSLPDLKQMVMAHGFDATEIADSLYEKILQNVADEQAGVIRLANMPQYTALRIELCSDTNMTNAILFNTNKPVEPSIQYVKKVISEAGIGDKDIDNFTLESLLNKLRTHEHGEIPICGAPQNAKVTFFIDQEDDTLKARIDNTYEKIEYTIESLKDTLKRDPFSQYQPDKSALEQILENIAKANISQINVGKRRSFVKVKFAFNPDTRKLDAIVTEDDRGPTPTPEVLQKQIKEKYSEYAIDNNALVQLFEKIENFEWGKYSIGERPEYTVIELIFDPSCDTLNAVLKASDVNRKTTRLELEEWIIEEGLNELYFEPNVLDKIIETARKNERGVYPVGKKVNAEISITVSKDEMSASITTKPAHGGLEINESRLMASIREAGIEPRFCKKDILEKVLLEASVNDLVFAEGKASVPGRNASFEALVKEFYYREVPETRSGKIDLNDLIEFTFVEEDTKLMRRVPATEGTEGYTVKGKVLKATPGIEIKYNKDLPGTKRAPDNEELLLAATKGHPVILKDGVKVDQTLIVNNVSSGTGNINFDGSLMVKGDIMAGMSVEVTGDVIVKGVVTDAMINAGNNVTVNIGIVGTAPIDMAEESCSNFEPQIVAGGSISAKYITLTRLKAGGNIEAKEYISHCICSAKNRILVGQAGGKGNLFGGDSRGESGVSVNLLGSDSGMKTFVTAGCVSSTQKDLEKLSENLATRQREAQQLDTIHKKYIGLVKANPKDIEKVKKLKVINSTISALKREIDKIISSIGKIKQQLNASRDADIRVTKVAYPNVNISINGATFQIRKESKGGRFSKFGSDIRWE